MNQDAVPLEISPSHYGPLKSSSQPDEPLQSSLDNSLKKDSSSSSSSSSSGSSVFGATFNFTNSIIGAGAIGLGGAFAQSGGIISVVTILFFAFVNKRSLDLIISLSLQLNTNDNDTSYESLGQHAFGAPGRIAVLLSKTLYSFGTLIAYIIVVKDNFGSGLGHLIYQNDYIATSSSSSDLSLSSSSSSYEEIGWFHQLILHDGILTLTVSALVIFPLCLLRDMAPLANVSIASVLAMVFIVIIIIYLYATTDANADHDHDSSTTSDVDPHYAPHEFDVYRDWIEIKPGFFESMGTFVFTFVCQNTVNLAYESIHPSVRTYSNWKTVSFYSILISACTSLTVGVFVYITFWEHTPSDIFQMYPSSTAVDCAKLLLSITMLFTCPLPFFTCREMVIIMMTDVYTFIMDCIVKGPPLPKQSLSLSESESELELELDHNHTATADLEIPLLSKEKIHSEPDLESLLLSSTYSNMELETLSEEASHSPIITPTARNKRTNIFFVLPKNHRQLKLPYHVFVTFWLWAIMTILAIFAPSLGDILDLVGSATGTAIAFVLPSLFSFRIIGFTYEAAFILLVGGLVGGVGTVFSIRQLVQDFP